MKNEKKGNTPKTAEGPARNEPEQSPPLGSPSGVVEALAQQLARDIDACLTSTQIAERALALLATPPQAPATPAAAPVEVRYEHLAHDDEMWASDEVEYEPGKWEMVGAKWMGEKYKDGMKRVRRKVPAPGSQGVEAPRKQTGK